MDKTAFRFILLVHFVFWFLWLAAGEVGADQKDTRGVRPSVLAGTWYPGSADELTKKIEGFLSRANPPPIHGKLRALIVPHAGYMYSGQVAAHAYKLLKGEHFRRIVLVGPSHRVSFDGVSVNLQSGYKTPLGIVPTDQEIAHKLLGAGSHFRWLGIAHAQEHCLEIQLPFLQTVLRNFRIVPMLMGRQDYQSCSKLSDTLVRILGDSEDTLILASTDLSHFHSYSQARALDLQFIKHVEGFDPKELAEDLSLGNCEACGGGAVVTTLLTAQQWGADRAVILNYANSGDVTGEHRRVVGYLSAALIRSSDKDPHPK